MASVAKEGRLVYYNVLSYFLNIGVLASKVQKYNDLHMMAIDPAPLQLATFPSHPTSVHAVAYDDADGDVRRNEKRKAYDEAEEITFFKKRKGLRTRNISRSPHAKEDGQSYVVNFNSSSH